MKNLFIFLLLAFSIASAQNQIKIPEVVKWTAVYAGQQKQMGEIQLIAKIQEGWHIYSQESLNDGPVPTTIAFELQPDQFELSGKTQEPSGEKKFDEAFAVDIRSFDKEAIFRQLIHRKTNKAFTIKGTIEFMTCNNVQCNPPRTISFSVTIPEAD